MEEPRVNPSEQTGWTWEQARREKRLRDGLRYVALVAAISLLMIPVSQVIVLLLEDLVAVPLFGVVGEDGVKTLPETSTAYFAVSCVTYFLMFALPIFLAYVLRPTDCKTPFALLSRTDKPKRDMVAEVLGFFPIILGGAYVMGVVASLLEGVYNTFGLVSPEIFQDIPTTPLGWVFYGIMLCVAAPVCEELLFRGALLSMLKPYGTGFAVACQAVLFAVFHGTVAQIPYTVVGGLLMGYLAVKYGGVLPGMLLHALNNGFSLVLELVIPASWWENPTVSLLLNLAVYTVFIAGGIVLIALRSKKDKALFAMGGESAADGLPGLTAFRTFFLHPAMLVYFGSTALLMLMTMTVPG